MKISYLCTSALIPPVGYRLFLVPVQQASIMRRIALLIVVLFFLAGCLGSSPLGCGEGYEEMHSGDYSIDSIDIDAATNQLTVVIHNEEGASGFIREVAALEQSQTIWVTLHVKHNGSTLSISGEDSGHSWSVSGDSSSGDSWSSLLTFTSPEGFCDSGCEEIRFSAGHYDGIIYHNGTCESSPWFAV